MSVSVIRHDDPLNYPRTWTWQAKSQNLTIKDAEIKRIEPNAKKEE